jgi:toxin FitB
MNVVDSCGWLSYFVRDGNADFFAPAIEDCAHLLVPGVVVYEVCKRLQQMKGEAARDLGLRYLKKGRFALADWDTFAMAALASKQYSLHMADAIIWQTAQQHGATLYTQDAAFDGLPGVAYQAKPPLAV